ncbi:MAG: hypothetical protein K2M37_01165 [Muribaculaceae bacterium]|nr:hypothetical protein [Muribaculaceae bacterium]
MNNTMILAIGGAGCNMAKAIMRIANASWVKEAAYLFADTDICHLSKLSKKGYETLILQHDSNSFPVEKFKGIENLYILAGLGGETGGNVAGIAARTAKSSGVENISLIVTLPFAFEGSRRLSKAKEALNSLPDVTVRVLPNDELKERYSDINFINAFAYSDKAVLNAIETGRP